MPYTPRPPAVAPLPSLPDAIRAGAFLHPQCRDSYFDITYKQSKEGQIMASCAIGAIYAATHPAPLNSIVHGKNEGIFLEVLKLYPALEDYTEHPITHRRQPRSQIVINLNDECAWTRERIADWLETDLSL